MTDYKSVEYYEDGKTVKRLIYDTRPLAQSPRGVICCLTKNEGCLTEKEIDAVLYEFCRQLGADPIDADTRRIAIKHAVRVVLNGRVMGQ